MAKSMKKTLAMLLSIAMLVGMMSVGFSALAEDDKPDTMEKTIASWSGEDFLDENLEVYEDKEIFTTFADEVLGWKAGAIDAGFHGWVLGNMLVGENYIVNLHIYIDPEDLPEEEPPVTSEPTESEPTESEPTESEPAALDDTSSDESTGSDNTSSDDTGSEPGEPEEPEDPVIFMVEIMSQSGCAQSYLIPYYYSDYQEAELLTDENGNPYKIASVVVPNTNYVVRDPGTDEITATYPATSAGNVRIWGQGFAPYMVYGMEFVEESTDFVLDTLNGEQVVNLFSHNSGEAVESGIGGIVTYSGRYAQNPYEDAKTYNCLGLTNTLIVGGMKANLEAGTYKVTANLKTEFGLAEQYLAIRVTNSQGAVVSEKLWTNSETLGMFGRNDRLDFYDLTTEFTVTESQAGEYSVGIYNIEDGTNIFLRSVAVTQTVPYTDVDYLIQEIDALPDEITAGDVENVLALKALFDSLTEEDQALVTNSADLDAAYAAALVIMKPDKVAAAIAAIDAIGVVADQELLEVGAKIEAAEALVAELVALYDEEVIGEVTNYETLTAARTEYDGLFATAKEEAAAAVEEAIAGLTTDITYENYKDQKEAVDTAKALYDAYINDYDGAQEDIEGADSLLAKVALINGYTTVDDLIARIDAIEEVTEENYEEIAAEVTEIETAYGELSEDMQALVTNYGDLEAIKDAIDQITQGSDVDAVIAAIDVIGEVTTENAAEIRLVLDDIQTMIDTLVEANGEEILDSITNLETYYQADRMTTVYEKGLTYGKMFEDAEKITAQDALKILKATTHALELTEDEQLAADVTVDGTVDAQDALAVLKYSVHALDSLPYIPQQETPEEPTDPEGGETTDPTDPEGGETTDPTDPEGGETTDPTDPEGGETTDPTDPEGGETTDPTDPEGGSENESPVLPTD